MVPGKAEIKFLKVEHEDGCKKFSRKQYVAPELAIFVHPDLDSATDGEAFADGLSLRELDVPVIRIITRYSSKDLSLLCGSQAFPTGKLAESVVVDIDSFLNEDLRILAQNVAHLMRPSAERKLNQQFYQRNQHADYEGPWWKEDTTRDIEHFAIEETIMADTRQHKDSDFPPNTIPWLMKVQGQQRAVVMHEEMGPVMVYEEMNPAKIHEELSLLDENPPAYTDEEMGFPDEKRPTSTTPLLELEYDEDEAPQLSISPGGLWFMVACMLCMLGMKLLVLCLLF